MRGSLVSAGVALAIAGSAPLAGAQGSGVMTHSSCAFALGSAGVASPCEDASAVLFNPAALALQGGALSFGVSAQRALGGFEFDNDNGRVDRDATVTWLPFGYLNYNVNERLSAALGIFAPYRLDSAWPAAFEGRYVSYDAHHTNYYLQPTIAYAASPRFSVGVGLDVVFSSLDLGQRADLALTPLPSSVPPVLGRRLTFGSLGVPIGTDFSDLRLTANGTGISFHVGALARITDQISVGARYLHSTAMNLKGDADFSPVLTNIVLPAGNPLSIPGNPFGFTAGSPVALDPLLTTEFLTGGRLEDQAIDTNMELPAQLVLGIAFTPSPALKVVGDYQWTGWATYDDAEIDFSGGATDTQILFDHQNTSTYRAGAEYRAGRAVSLRGGFAHSTPAQRDLGVSPLGAEAERNHYAFGLAWNFRAGMTLDLGAQIVDQADRRGRVREIAPEMTPAELAALNVGLYTSTAQLFSATFSYRFGAAR